MWRWIVLLIKKQLDKHTGTEMVGVFVQYSLLPLIAIWQRAATKIDSGDDSGPKLNPNRHSVVANGTKLNNGVGKLDCIK